MLSTLLVLSLAAAPADAVRAELQSRWRQRLEPMLSEVLRFPTVEGNAEAFAAQKSWLARVGPELGLVVRDRETMTELELPGPDGAPVLGLVVHGDVQPVNASEWSVAPFSGEVKGGFVWGRGAADDKGPLVQALLVMAALKSSGLPRTHTVRLLVGTDEESGGTDLEAYRKKYPLPDYSLVLDSDFPVVVGEKAWAEWIVTADERAEPSSGKVEVVDLSAGQAVSIVPDQARLVLRWKSGEPDWDRWLTPVRTAKLPPGTSLQVSGTGAERTLIAHGRAAHAGIALGRGRNALLALADAVEGRLPPSAAADLLAYVHVAGRDPLGGGLGLGMKDPIWGGVETNFGVVDRGADGRLALHVNLRSPPSLWGEALKARVDENARAFAGRRGARFTTGGRFEYEPYMVPEDSPLVQRLLAAYARGAGRPAKPVVSAGGTYARRLGAAIAFGMWFREDGQYPGHAADERVQIRSLDRGLRVLVEAVVDLATGARLENPVASRGSARP